MSAEEIFLKHFNKEEEKRGDALSTIQDLEKDREIWAFVLACMEEYKDQFVHAEGKAEWISVSERLPSESGKMYLVHGRSSGQLVVPFHKNSSDFWLTFYTHWMPMPNIPNP